ncbi:hypothetical protein AUJ68_06900 [Candidatus Woesearchaeota archaeon CG1_02_57_44]|nr:MAG: hypothetical protein AUJ68_06900 [Candidatus Woesearchaeota archaeon CG1_02_57_44]
MQRIIMEHTSRKTIVIVQKAVTLDGDKALIIRRSMDSKRHPGQWDLPGGKLETGEDMQEALIREIEEETGLKATDIRLLCAFSQDEPSRYGIRLGYAVQVNGSNKDITLSHEHTEFAWVPVEQLAKIDTSEANMRIIASYLQSRTPT